MMLSLEAYQECEDFLRAYCAIIPSSLLCLAILLKRNGLPSPLWAS